MNTWTVYIPASDREIIAARTPEQAALKYLATCQWLDLKPRSHLVWVQDREAGGPYQVVKVVYPPVSENL